MSECLWCVNASVSDFISCLFLFLFCYITDAVPGVYLNHLIVAPLGAAKVVLLFFFCEFCFAFVTVTTPCTGEATTLGW